MATFKSNENQTMFFFLLNLPRSNILVKGKETGSTIQVASEDKNYT